MPCRPECLSILFVQVIVNQDGTTERWRQPRLAPWEVPRRDPAEPRPKAPDVAARRRAVRQAVAFASAAPRGMNLRWTRWRGLCSNLFRFRYANVQTKS